MTLSPTFPMRLPVLNEEEELFYGVVERLKAQNALPAHCFLKELPFFNVSSLPKETQLRELYEISCDPELCKRLLRRIEPYAEAVETRILPRNFTSVSVMSFAQIVLYKVLPCLNADCKRCPREIATHNQYRDFEYSCPFYHHERDRRRLVITPNPDQEFAYKANYFEEGRRKGEKGKHSQNYFESMFHPLYYKMFRCKREFCDASAFCPFHHSPEEKKLWDQTFSHFINKDRVSYVKDKQKPEKKQKGSVQRKDSYEDDVMPRGSPGYDNKHIHQKLLVNRPNYQQPDQNLEEKSFFERYPMLNKFANVKTEMSHSRKDSEDSSFEEKYSRGLFYKLLRPKGFEIH